MKGLEILFIFVVLTGLVHFVLCFFESDNKKSILIVLSFLVLLNVFMYLLATIPLLALALVGVLYFKKLVRA